MVSIDARMTYCCCVAHCTGGWRACTEAKHGMNGRFETVPDAVFHYVVVLQGQWNITAGQNDLFDAFDCQKHYFRVSEPGVLYADINWRVQKNNGDFLERSAVQTFKQVLASCPCCLPVLSPRDGQWTTTSNI